MDKYRVMIVELRLHAVSADRDSKIRIFGLLFINFNDSVIIGIEKIAGAGGNPCIVQTDFLHAPGGNFCRFLCREDIRLLPVTDRMDEKVDVGEYFLLPQIIEYGHWVSGIVSEEFFNTIRDIQNPAQVQKNSDTGFKTVFLPAGDGFTADVNILCSKSVSKLCL